MIHLDTSALIAALCGERVAAPRLRQFVSDGERIGISSLVLYQWWRGPRSPDELLDQEALFPASDACGFGAVEAAIAAELYRHLKRPRHRQIDLAIAACALTQGAALWTLNPEDFADIPSLELA